MKIRYIGIDIGTSSTVVKLRDNDDSNKSLKYPTQTLRIGGDAIIPSVAFVVNNDFKDVANFRFGSDALSCQLEGSLYVNFKMDLLSEDKDRQNHAKILIAHFMKWIRKHYEEQQIDYFGSCDQEVTIVSYPVRWSEELRRFMRSAAYEAGFRNVFTDDKQEVDGRDEAEAAIRYLLFSQLQILQQYGVGKTEGILKIMLIDMGAGTIDIIFGEFNVAEKKLSVIACYPETDADASAGGSEFDDKVFQMVDNYLKSNGIVINGNDYCQQMITACKIWKEKQLSANLNEDQVIVQIPAFLKPFLLSKPGHLPFPKINRDIFEVIFVDEIEKFSNIIEAAFERAVSTGAIASKKEIELVALTGGHSQWYFIPELLTGKRHSPTDRDVSIPVLKDATSKLFHLSNPSETVALGLVYNDDDSFASSDHVVTFDVRDGSQPLKKTVMFSETVDKPTIPFRNGYIFCGWYRDSSCTVSYDFDAPVVEDLTVYAKWRKSELMPPHESAYHEDLQTLDIMGGDKMKKNANLLVAGKCGVGKTTLVNSMFNAHVGHVGTGATQTAGINRYEIPNFPITVYDVQGFEIENTDKIITQIKNTIQKQQLQGDKSELVHAIVYCISCVGKRFEPGEETFIRKLKSEFGVAVFIAFTQAVEYDDSNSETHELIRYVKSLELPVDGYYAVLCEKEYGYEPFGVDEMMDAVVAEVIRQLPHIEALADKAALNAKHDRAVKWIWGYAAANFALGAVIPAGADVAYLMGIESGMALHITMIMYKGTDMDIKDVISEVVAACAGPILASVGGTIAFNEVIKVGSYLLAIPTGGLSVSAAAVAGGLVAAGITIAMGRTYLWIAEGLLTGKIKKEELINKDPKRIAEVRKQMKDNYTAAREQMKGDDRFSKKAFKSK